MKKIYSILPGLLFCPILLWAQNTSKIIREGNEQYRKQEFVPAEKSYQKALEAAPDDAVTQYNLGNASFRNEQWDAAIQAYDQAISNSKDPELTQRAWYNKGVALSKAKKLAESIDAYKQALQMDPADQQARENLQKALLELKKQQPPPPPQKQDDKKKQQQQQQKPQPKPSSTMSKERAEQLLKALQQKEQEIQKKMQQNKARSSSRPEKDW